MIRSSLHKEFSDTELIEHYCQSGDVQFIGDLYERYMHLVYGVCLKYLKEREDAKDAVVQLFEKIVTEIPRQKIENFKPWLYVVTKNHCLMQLRSKQTEHKHEKEWQINAITFMESNEELHPLDNGNGQELDKALKDCIQKLKNEQRECIELFYFDNRCYQEVSDLLNIDIKKVKSYIQNGKRNLKICLEHKHVTIEQ
jgi:RNA polymerase sigma-70 factor (ECF subfamily)